MERRGRGGEGAERRGGCIAWGIGRKGREGGAGAGSRKCGRGCGNGREGTRGCGGIRGGAGEYEGKLGDVGKRGRARKKRGKM